MGCVVWKMVTLLVGSPRAYSSLTRSPSGFPGWLKGGGDFGVGGVVGDLAGVVDRGILPDFVSQGPSEWG